MPQHLSCATVGYNLFKRRTAPAGGDSEFADGVTYGGQAPAFSLPDPVSATKAAAAYKAVKSSGSDLIVAPRYAVSVEDYFIFKKVNVTVTGNKGSIKNIR